MEPIEHIPVFLEAMTYAKQSTGQPMEERAHSFVTISRQAGAGAHSLARAILQEMAKEPDFIHFQRWYIFDAAMCKKVLDEARLRCSLKSVLAEEFHSEVEDIVYQLLVDHAPQGMIFEKTFTAIRSLASLGKGIFIGRGGACVTGDMPLGIHLRLVAPLEVRVERMAKEWKVAGRTAQKQILELDAQRARMIRHYFGKDIESPLLYHMVFNTAELPLGEIARLVIGMIERREQRKTLQLTAPCSLTAY